MVGVVGEVVLGVVELVLGVGVLAMTSGQGTGQF